jgi:hypothetical protein
MRRPRGLGVPELFLGLLAIAVAVVWTAYITTNTIRGLRHTRDTVTVTGSARKPISANLVKWTLTVAGTDASPAVAARDLRSEVAAVRSFLLRGQVPAAAITPAVVERETLVTKIDKHRTRTRYRVSQSIDISTAQIDLVERIAPHLGELIEHDIDVSAEPLEYLSTELTQQKLAALQAATQEVRRRADILVRGLGGRLGRMRSSTLGVYQVTPRDSTDVSDYGINDTSTREKDVTAVVTATFHVDR